MLLPGRLARAVRPHQEGAHEGQRDTARLPHEQICAAHLSGLLPAAEEAPAGAAEQPNLEHHSRASIH